MAKKKQQFFHHPDQAHIETKGSSTPTPTPVLKDPRNEVLKGQTRNQHAYIRDLQASDAPYVVAHGPAGTGKTYPAVVHGVKKLAAGDISRLVITRPLVNVEEEEVGTLPGGIIEKVSPWMLPILDILKEFYTPHQLADMLAKEVIEIAPLAFMRGRTFKKVLLIADEMQNATPNQMKMLLTRIGKESRFIITGDIEQTDRTRKQNGLLDLTKRIEEFGPSDFAVTKFEQSDVVRHGSIDNVLTMFADARPTGRATWETMPSFLGEEATLKAA